MGVYLGFTLTLLIFGFFSLDKKYKSIFVFLTFVVFVLFVALRFETGFDWHLYKKEFLEININNSFFKEVSSISRSYNHEFMFVSLLYLIKLFFKDFIFVNIISSLFLYYSYLKISRKFEINVIPFITIVLLFSLFTVHFSVLRQSISLSFFILAVTNVFVNVRKTVFFIILSILFHSSAYIYLGILVFSILISRLSRRLIIFGYSLVFIIGFVIPQLIIHYKIGGFLANKLNYYLNKSYSGNIMEVSFTIGFYLFIVFCVYVFRNKNNLRKWILHFLLLSVLLSLMFFNVKTIRSRIFYIQVIVFGIYVLKNKRSNFIIKDYNVLIMYSCAFLMYIASLLKTNSIAYIPYQSYFQVWLFDDYGNGQSRQDYIIFKAFEKERIKIMGKEKYYKKLKELEKRAKKDVSFP